MAPSEAAGPPGFLTTGTAALLAEAPAPPAPLAPAAAGTLAARLHQELLRRLEAGETRLWPDDLSVLGADHDGLAEAFRELRRTNLLDWEAGTPYLYLGRASAGPVPAPEAPEFGLAEAVRVLEEATGKMVNPLLQPRLQEWLATLGQQEFLDVVGLCRERGPCDYRRLAFELDKAMNRRRRVSEFGAVMGLGVVPSGAGQPGTGAGPVTPEPLANASAYEPVPPERVEEWVKAHPELYATAAPPPATGGWAAAQASAYDRVSAEQVKRWVEAFPEVYEPFFREYSRLVRLTNGPFRRKAPRVR
ncbi:MAG: hypothetical protein ACM3RP_06945 [Chitinophagales bacterium]